MPKALAVDKGLDMPVGKEEELSAIRKQQKLSSDGRIADDSRDRLKRIAFKKMRTCFIAALAEFETAFGLEVWGHQLPDEMLTQQQRVNKEKWERVRKNILDKGNVQSRAFGMEIDLHKIDFIGYQTTFVGGKNRGR